MVPAGNSLEPLLCPGKTIWESLLWCKAVAPKAQLSLEPHATSFCFPTAGTRYNRELLMPWRAQLMGRMCLLYTRSRFFSVKGDCISSWALMKHNFCFEELTTGLPQIVTFTDPWKHRNQKQRCSVMESYSSAGMKNCFLTWACFFFPPFLLFFPPVWEKTILWGFNEFLSRACHSATLLGVHDKWPSLPCKILCHWSTCLQRTWSLLNFPFLWLYTFPNFWRVWKEEMKACEDQNKIPYITRYVAF